MSKAIVSKVEGQTQEDFSHHTNQIIQETTQKVFYATNLRYIMKKDIDYIAALIGETPENVSSHYLRPTISILHSLMNETIEWQ